MSVDPFDDLSFDLGIQGGVAKSQAVDAFLVHEHQAIGAVGSYPLFDLGEGGTYQNTWLPIGILDDQALCPENLF